MSVSLQDGEDKIARPGVILGYVTLYSNAIPRAGYCDAMHFMLCVAVYGEQLHYGFPTKSILYLIFDFLICYSSVI